MLVLRSLAAAAAVMTFASTAKSQGTEGPMVVAFFNQEKTAGDGDVTGSIPRGLSASSERRGAGRGGLEKQTASVSIGCLKPELTRIIRDASSHFGATAVITSGYRPGRHSYHGRCMAADVQIPGVSPGALARWFRSQPASAASAPMATRARCMSMSPRASIPGTMAAASASRGAATRGRDVIGGALPSPSGEGGPRSGSDEGEPPA